MHPDATAPPVALCCALAVAALSLAPGRADAEPQAALDFGASVRIRYEAADAAFLGPADTRATHVLLTRVLTSASLRDPARAGAYVQLGWHDEAGRGSRVLPTDVDGVDVQQAYADLELSDSVSLRLGRQEVVLGSARLVAVRESPNIRRSFDGVTLRVRHRDWAFRALALAAVTNSRGAFDDATRDDVRLAGVYATRTARGAGAGPGLDLYALRYSNANARYSLGVGPERRWSFGTRLFATEDALDYNVEAIVQSGSFGARAIRAWTLASDTGYTLASATFSPRFGLKANVTSGDRDARDLRLGTFNPLFPNLAYFSEASTLAPQNHADLQLSTALRPAERWMLRIGLDRFWRTSRFDAVYRNNGAPYTVSGASRRVAQQATLDLGWRPAPTVEAKASVVHWRPSATLVRAGARETWFAMVSVAANW